MSNSRTFRRKIVAVAAGGALSAAGALVGLSSETAYAFGTQPTAVTAPNPSALSAGQSNQPGAPYAITVPNTFSAGDTIQLEVQPTNATYTGAPPHHLNQSATNDYVGFASLPTVTVTPVTGNTGTTDTAPTVTEALTYDPGDGPGMSSVAAGDILTITVGNNASGTAGDQYLLTVGGISYNVGSATPVGNIATQLSYTNAGGSATPTVLTTGGNASDATVTHVTATSASPPVGIQGSFGGLGAPNAALPNVVVTESVPGAVSTSITLTTADPTESFVTVPTVSVSGGGAAIGAGVRSTSARAGASNDVVTYPVTTASTGTPAAYTFSGINMSFNGTNPLAPVGVSVAANSVAVPVVGYGAGAPFVALGAIRLTDRFSGQTADDTAAAVFTAGAGIAAPFAVAGQTGTSHGVANAVLATDQSYSDALASSYLAGQLKTGILLTSPSSLPQSTITALRLENVQSVYVIGGPLAINPSVVSQLQATQAYFNGSPEVDSGGNAVNLKIISISGPTLYDTADAIDNYFGATGNTITGMAAAIGDPSFNDTTGMSSTTAPAADSPTAILVTGNGYADAISASPLAAGYKVPIVLTDGTQATLSDQAQADLVNLHIGQVLVVGGPLAISDGIVAQMQSMGIAVLRVAGTDYADTSKLVAQLDTNTQYLKNGAFGFATLVRGDYWADGVTAGPFTGQDGVFGNAGSGEIEPVLLTEGPGNLGSSTPNFLALTEGGGTTAEPLHTLLGLIVVGGPLAVTPSDLQTAVNDMTVDLFSPHP